MTRAHPPTSPHIQAPWVAVLCVVALDYLSTLGYQPSLAFRAGGLLAPLATVVVVLVTLLAALPVYLYVAGQSPHGGGATALLERLVPGWRGKLLILIVLGFIATDFIFTRTFSAAAAAEHLVHNPQPEWQGLLDRVAYTGTEWGKSFDHPAAVWLAAHSNKRLAVTLVLLLASSALGLAFFRGFSRGMLRLVVVVVAVFLLLNAVVIGSGLAYLASHPEVVTEWWHRVWAGDWQQPGAPHRPPQDAWSLAAACFAMFPKLALGLSGFELTMIVMPVVRGRPGDDPRRPVGRIRDTRKLLVAAALLGSIALLASAFVTSLLVPPAAFAPDGDATHRALAYLAHGESLATGGPATNLNPLFGPWFGSLYDCSAVTILCLAGMSVSIGLRDLVPPYLHRLGMELDWSLRLGALLFGFTVVKLLVTVYFQADLDSQRDAYATAVLALLTAAALACALQRRHSVTATGRHPVPFMFGAFAVGFAIASIITVWGRPAGLSIASMFIVLIVASSMVSRGLRSTELRFQGFEYVNDESQFLWQSLRTMDFPVLVPHCPGRHCLAEKEAAIRARHRLPPEMPVVFVEVTLGDASGFYHLPLLEVTQEDGRFVIRIERCASVAHVLAAVALELSKESIPPELHFGWSHESPLTANLHFVLFGHGNVPWMVQYLLSRAEPDASRRPRVVIG
jgi:hypothetical protein